MQQRVIPPSDLLARVDGVESTLRVSKRLGTFGWFAFAVSVVEVSALVLTSDPWKRASNLQWSDLGNDWPIVAPTLLLIVSVLLVNWTRFWVRESKAPFRYTYSIDEYEPLGDTDAEPRLLWLQEDLAERLSRRIGRLSLLDKKEAAEREAHIHVFGLEHDPVLFRGRDSPQGRAPLRRTGMYFHSDARRSFRWSVRDPQTTRPVAGSVRRQLTPGGLSCPISPFVN